MVSLFRHTTTKQLHILPVYIGVFCFSIYIYIYIFRNCSALFCYPISVCSGSCWAEALVILHRLVTWIHLNDFCVEINIPGLSNTNLAVPLTMRQAQRCFYCNICHYKQIAFQLNHYLLPIIIIISSISR